MNEQTKKVLLICLAVLALVFAVGSGYFATRGDQVQVVRTGPKPPAGKLWGKAAMMARDNAAGPANPGGKSGSKAGDPGALGK